MAENQETLPAILPRAVSGSPGLGAIEKRDTIIRDYTQGREIHYSIDLANAYCGPCESAVSHCRRTINNCKKAITLYESCLIRRAGKSCALARRMADAEAENEADRRRYAFLYARTLEALQKYVTAQKILEERDSVHFINRMLFQVTRWKAKWIAIWALVDRNSQYAKEGADRYIESGQRTATQMQRSILQNLEDALYWVKDREAIVVKDIVRVIGHLSHGAQTQQLQFVLRRLSLWHNIMSSISVRNLAR